MNFQEAVEAMKEGKKVQSAFKDSYYFIEGKVLKYYSDTRDKIEEITEILDLITLDRNWEIYEEEDDWNFYEKGAYDKDNMIKLKEKILGDIKMLNDEEFNYINIEDILNKRFGF